MTRESNMSNIRNMNIIKKDEELAPELFHVAREKGTEIPYTGKYVETKEKGTYMCAICGTALFSSDTKFDSGTGWPSFTEPANRGHIALAEDTGNGSKRTEVLCKTCGAHLGMYLTTAQKPAAASATASTRCVWSLEPVHNLPPS